MNENILWSQNRHFYRKLRINPCPAFANSVDLDQLASEEANWSSFANSVDPDQLASQEANWSGSALSAIQYVNLYQQSGSSNLIGWQLEMGVAS